MLPSVHWGQSARWQLALMLLKQLEDQLAHGNDITFTAVINACERAEDAKLQDAQGQEFDSLCGSPGRNALSSLRALSCPYKNCMIYTVYFNLSYHHRHHHHHHHHHPPILLYIIYIVVLHNSYSHLLLLRLLLLQTTTTTGAEWLFLLLLRLPWGL